MQNDAAAVPQRITAPRAVLALVFCCSILLPLIGQLASLDKSSPLGEKRELAPLPSWEWSRESVAEWPGTFEQYYNDHFGFRNFLVRSFYITRIHWLGLSPPLLKGKPVADDNPRIHALPRIVPQVLVGKDGWCFYTLNGEIDDYRRTRRFAPEDLEFYAKTFRDRAAWCRSVGARYIVVTIPNKSTIYPQYMPDIISVQEGKSARELYSERMEKDQTFDYLDLTEALREASRHEEIYMRTDTHWNNKGAHVGYTEIMNLLSAADSRLRPLPLSEFDVTPFVNVQADLATTLGMSEIMPSIEYKFTPRFQEKSIAVENIFRPNFLGIKPVATYEIPGSDLPKVMVMHDSFGHWLIPFLKHHFSRSVFYLNVDFSSEVIAAERPDFVIDITVERNAMVITRANYPEVHDAAERLGPQRRLRP